MTEPNPRMNRLAEIVKQQCKKKNLSTEATEIGVEFAKHGLRTLNFSLKRAIREGVEVAEGQQKRIDDSNRRHLREVIVADSQS